jgi:tetratricopeptide (TPR) repeat protein
VVAERITAYLVGVQERLRKAELALVEERARRRLTMAVAASVLGLLIVGGGGWAYLQRLKADRRAAVERRVTAVLDEANLLRGQASTAPAGELGRWDEAIAAARRAEVMLDDGEAGEAVRGRVLAAMSGLKQGRAEAQAKADELRRDRELLARLESIYGGMSQHMDIQRFDAEITAALRDFGIDLDRLDPKEAGRRIHARSAPAELAGNLEGLAMFRALIGRPEADWHRLVDAARVADPDPWRNSLRDLIGRRDAAAVAELRKLADDEKLLEAQPAMGLVLLATQLQFLGDRARGEAVLRRAWRLQPGEFVVNSVLGMWFQDESVPPKELAARRTEAVRFFTAAVAIRPTNAMAHANLGGVLRAQGKLEDAVAEYRTAIRLNRDVDWFHNNLALALQDQGKLDEAITEYRAAIRIWPDSATAHGNLAVALQAQGKVEEAVAEGRTAVRLRPDGVWDRNKLAGVLQAQGKLEEAIAEYRAAIRLKPDDSWAHSNLGIALRLQGKRDDAIAEFRRAAQLEPEQAVFLVNVVETLLQQGRRDEAVAEYRAALRINPNLDWIHNNFGCLLLDLGKREESAAEFREAIRINPDYADAHSNLGVALQAQGKLEEAVAECRTAIRIRPDNAVDRTKLGAALQARGKLEEAVAEYREAIRLKPDLDQAHALLGNALTVQGRREEAIKEYREAIRLKPDVAWFHNHLGDVLRGQAKLAEAIDEYRTAIRVQPDYVWAHVNLGVALQRQGKRDEAIVEYRETVRLMKPDDAGIRNVLAWRMALPSDRPRTEYDEAAEYARNAVALAPKDGDIYNTLALAKYRCGRWDESIAATERSMALRRGGNAWDWFILAMAHARKGNKDEALKWFDKAVAWTEQKASDNADLRQFWGEAAKLLGRAGPGVVTPAGK